jgi:hypothetical protein
MADSSISEYQRQALAMMKAQQEAYLDAVRAWKDASLAGRATPPWPEAPPIGSLPSASEVAEAYAEFAAKLLEEQSGFMRQLSETLAAASKNR